MPFLFIVQGFSSRLEHISQLSGVVIVYFSGLIVDNDIIGFIFNRIHIVGYFGLYSFVLRYCADKICL